jgi:Na+-transporting NADH:ubiquinone oxidoreductase subunit C
VKEKLYIVGFTLTVTAVFVLVVSAINVALAGQRERNRKVARQSVILRLIGLRPRGERWSGERVLRTFDEAVEPVTVPAEEGFDYTYWRLTDKADPTTDAGADGGGERVVIPAAGQGFWGGIQGYLALDPSAGRIRDVAFPKHEETPGLGGRIGEEDFEARFRDVPYTAVGDDGRRIDFVPPGTADAPNEVDSITGATGTSMAIERIVSEAIDLYLRVRGRQGADG